MRGRNLPENIINFCHDVPFGFQNDPFGGKGKPVPLRHGGGANAASLVNQFDRGGVQNGACAKFLGVIGRLINRADRRPGIAEENSGKG